MHSKKQLLRAIPKETRPAKGFGQWILVFEHRRVSADLGLFLVEAQLDGKVEWSCSVSVNLPEEKKFGPDGQPIPGEWEKLEAGQSRYNVLTLEMRGRSFGEQIKGFFKRTLEEGKLQDIPFLGKL
jgi:hypothetical protein